MATEHHGRDIHIGLTNLSLAGSDMLRYNEADYTAAIYLGGYDVTAGYEWSDVRVPKARAAGKALAKHGLISVLHESWRERTLGNVLALRDGSAEPISKAAELQITAVLPLLDKSYDPLNKVGEKTGRKLPIIIHPAGQHLGEQPPRRPRQQVPDGLFSEQWYQPTVEWAVNNGIKLDSHDPTDMASEITALQAKQGLDGIALDINHLLASRDKRRFPDPGSLAVALAQHDSLREIQVSLRPEFGGDSETLSKACNGELARTSTGEILTRIHRSLPAKKPLRLVTEVAAGEIQQLGIHDYLSAHGDITLSIRDIFGQVL